MAHTFSANLVTEPLLPLAAYLGNNPGYTAPGKMDIPIEIERGCVLPVPVLQDSPWVFELEVNRSIPLDNNEVFLCKIRNVLAVRELTDETKSAQERLKGIKPAVWIGAGPYFPVNPAALGAAGDWKDLYKKGKR